MTTRDILKPSILGQPESLANTSTTSPISALNLSQLKETIAEIIRSENQRFFRPSASPNTSSNNDTDQTIDSQYLTNLNDMDKIPDVVKSLREFSGKPGEYGSWKKSVDRILKIYENLKGTPKYYGILSVIRNKITGNADTALESYNTPLNWEKISKCLALHYADKRDLGTLEYQMTTLVQRNNTVPEFYQQVYYHLSLILNKLSSMEMSQESLNVMTQAYRDKALDTFIRGLKGDLPRLLSMRGPEDLPEALHLCLKLENVHYRVQHSHGNIRSQQPPLPPPITPRRIIAQPQQNRNFYPQLLHNPQAPQNFWKPPSYLRQHPPRYPQQQNQQPPKLPYRNYYQKIEPMDIDHSIHSKQVNYQNKPQMQNYDNKRPHSQQIQQPTKLQRIYHSEQIDEDPELAYYHEQMPAYDTQYDQTLVEYTDSQDPTQPPETTDYEDDPNPQKPTEHLDDVHFLD